MPAVALILSIALPLPCPFVMPVDGPIVRDFAPAGWYGGHWGIDFEVGMGTEVRPAAPGRVSFAGDIAGRLSVTIHHGGGVRTSYSYLSDIRVGRGDLIGPSTVLGLSGVDHGIEALHFSVRIGDDYVRPLVGACRLAPSAALRLGAPGPLYPSGGATRHPRRDLRSTPHRPPHRGRVRLSRIGARRRDVHAGRRPMAEGGA